MFPGTMPAGLNIAALAHRTGVAAETLRKWEQRYQILQPSRTAGGQRRYSERGVARVACAPGEQHELGLMMAAIALRRDGWKVVYLGADTPLQDALDLAGLVSARLLGLSVAMAERAASLETALRTAKPPEGLSVVLGGAGASRVLAR